jgi:DNA processing protein
MPALALDRDAQAIAMLCSRMALPREGGPKSFGPAEWNRLAGVLRSTAYGRPGDLLGRSAAELAAELAIAREQAERIHDLLSRGGQLAMEMERLARRGIWILTRADEDYPIRLKERLRGDAPPLFFGAGPRSLLAAGGVAVVGSRDADDEALTFAREVGRWCAREHTPVVSGAARGIDITAMLSALDAGGSAIGIAAEALERLVRRRELREALADDSLVIISPHHPATRFHTGNAMRRNRLIYCAADVAVVVASAGERGGTRAGALEALDAGWIPVLVRDDGSRGNEDLMRRGAQPLTMPAPIIDAAYRPVASSLFDAVPAQSHEPATIDREASDAPPQLSPDDEREHGIRDLFHSVWPQLAAFLIVPRSETDVAEHFQLQRTQARAWLTRAVDEQHIRREGRQRRYVLADGQQSLETPEASRA